MSSAFTELASPSISVSLSNLVKINDHEFVGASYKTQYGSKDELGLYRYNTLCNEWNVVLKYPEDLMVKAHSICYDKDNQIIYLYGYPSQIVIINLQTLKIDHVKKDFPHIGISPILLMINDECHIILGSDSKYHYKWNSKLKKLDEVFEFSHVKDGLSYHGIVNITSRNKLLLFGGYDPGLDRCFNALWEYDMNETYKYYKWRELNDVKLPMKMYDFGWILSNDEQYLIIFGGEDVDCERLTNIFILDLSDMTFYQSAVRLCHKGDTRAVSMKNDKDVVLVSGFIRNVSREYDTNIPSDLLILLSCYFESEMIYLFHGRTFRYNEGTMLCKIELNDILKNKTQIYV